LGERESYYPVKENLRRNNLEKIEKGKQRREIKNPIKSIKDRIGNSINFILFFFLSFLMNQTFLLIRCGEKTETGENK
jgi:hypothetical protein